MVVGGGLTGLAAAWEASRVPGLKVTLVEKETRLGGKVATASFPGGYLEKGPDSFLLREPGFVQFLKDLGLYSSLQEPETLAPLIRFGGRFHRLPEGLAGIAPWHRGYLRSSLLSLKGKAAVTRDLFLPPRGDAPWEDESFFDFASRHFGEEWAQRVVAPLYGGIYAGDAKELSTAALQPSWVKDEREEGSLIRAAQKRRQAGKAGPPFRTLPRGLQDLVKALEEDLVRRGVELRRGEEARSLDVLEGKVRLTTGKGLLFGDGVVLSLPAPQAGKLLETRAPRLARLLMGQAWVSSGALLFRITETEKRNALAGHPLFQGSGFLVPRGEGKVITGATVLSRKWPQLSRGAFHLRLFVGRRHEEEILSLPDDLLWERAWRELQRFAGPLPLPDEVLVSRFPLAFPQYRVGHGPWLEEVRREEGKWPWLFLAGTSYEGVAIPDAVRQGREAGQKVVRFLSGPPQPPSISKALDR